MRSLGDSTLSSIPAGGTRKNKRQNTIKESAMNFTINGRQFKAVPTDACSTKSVTGKAKKVASKVSTVKSSQKKADGIRRPKGYPRKKWATLDRAGKLAVEAKSIPIDSGGLPPRVNSQLRRKVPNNVSSDSSNQGYGAVDFDWKQSRYIETADPFWKLD